jgi:hypothetical protein
VTRKKFLENKQLLCSTLQGKIFRKKVRTNADIKWQKDLEGKKVEFIRLLGKTIGNFRPSRSKK